MELVDVVDKDDNVLKTIDRAEATDDNILRVANVMISNTKNEILLQLRSAKKEKYPLYWDCSGGGHVDSGEDYTTAARRELLEELGIEADLEFFGKHYIELTDGRKHQAAFYKASYDGKINIDPKEVAKAQFFSLETIKKMIKTGEKFHPECLFVLKEYFF
ncbi:NUDIX hydrolase [Candidatus Woesearchaeota archaeon CG10_big_fil_rev_8_21_14_0_10_37_12]|nr:MAG: NUDIX hydrolase [Candidatus Woesearchaeota archaeon CG10_big_fil_rev_8_21_14_0_10_37_12]